MEPIEDMVEEREYKSELAKKVKNTQKSNKGIKDEKSPQTNLPKLYIDPYSPEYKLTMNNTLGIHLHKINKPVDVLKSLSDKDKKIKIKIL